MGAEVEFNSIQFEKKLSSLKDSQESINACCLWCLENRIHHKKIVTTWLNVLKRVRVEQRLTLFYLANDVIQYSKRKNYEFVESWGTALQKATTMVRDEKVKHKILRIFKIWEQRGVYGDEFITDLSGLISASPTAKKTDESHEFQSSYLINKIRGCAKLEADTDHKLKLFKQHNPKMLDCEALVSSLKDRAHVDDVEKEMDDYVDHMEEYVNALKLEIKTRHTLINLLGNAETQLERDRKDVKVVAVAYKSFQTRVKNLKKKLDEKKATLLSPIPSPDINAPSPSPDSDIELPEDSKITESSNNFGTSELFTFPNAGFYNPVTTSTTDATNSFVNNGFSSFMGSGAPFNMQNLNTSALFSNSVDSNTHQQTTLSNQTHTTDSNYGQNNLASLFPSIIQPPPPPAPVPPVTVPYQYNQQMPLAPPPLPPFTKNDSSIYGSDNMYNDYSPTPNNSYGNGSYNPQPTPVDPYQPTIPYTPTIQNYNTEPSYSTSSTNFDSTAPTNDQQSYAYDPYNPDEYNPEEELETWDTEEQWDQPPQALDTPASPPPLDKEAFMDPIEYHEEPDMLGAIDIDHREFDMAKNALENIKDIDHRNLISLTGSPKDSGDMKNNEWKAHGDQDYRNTNSNLNNPKDVDYRTPPETANYVPTPIISLGQHKKDTHSPRKLQDNTESIDMELSDDEIDQNNESTNEESNSIDYSLNGGLLPPPPFPNDTDANNFLNSLNDELNYDDSFCDFNEIQQHQDSQTSQQMTQVPPQQMQQQMQREEDAQLDECWDDSMQQNEGLLGDHPNYNPNDSWDPEYQHQDMNFRNRGRGNRGHFAGNNHRGEFNNWGDFRGRGRVGFRGGPNKFRGGWNGDQRNNKPRGRGRGWGGERRGFNPRGNFRGGMFANNY